MTYKIKKIGSLLLIVLLCLSYVAIVNAAWTSPDIVYDVENINSDGEVSCWSSSSNQIFYHNSSDRWYIIYAKDVGTYDYQMYYSYSDAGDLTNWTNGGLVTSSKLRDSAWSSNPVGYYFAWVYDETNAIGHLAFAQDGSVTSAGLQYMNFTIGVGGALTFGSIREIVDFGGGNIYCSVDMALTHNNYPIIAFGGNYGATNHNFGALCNSTDGYNGNWEAIEFRAYGYGGCAISVFPTGNDSCILIMSDVTSANSMKYFEINFTTPTSNSTGSGTTFSDTTLYRYDLLNNQDAVFHGISYNTTHGAVHYSATDYDSYAFVFDLSNVTDKTTEYQTSDGGTSNTFTLWNGLTIDDHEFFSSMERRDPSNISAYGNEYHNPLYDSYFNYTAEDYILEDWTPFSEYSGSPVNTARFTDEGVGLIMVEHGDYVAVTYWTVTGEYAATSEEQSIFDEYVDLIVAFFVPLLVILFCAWLGWRWMGGAGFVVGLNVGLLITVILMNVPEYSIVIMLIVDAALFIGGRNN